MTKQEAQATAQATAQAVWAAAEGLRLAGDSRAVSGYRRVLALVPGFMPAMANLGLVLGWLPESLRGMEAVSASLRAVALDPEHRQLRLNLGNAWAEAGRADRAAGALRRGLALDPSHAEAWLNLGVALQAGGDLSGDGLSRYGLSGAARAAARAVAVRPTYAEAWNNLANARRDQGFAAAAERAYLQALALRPDYADAARNLLAARLYVDDDDERAGADAAAFCRRFGPGDVPGDVTPGDVPGTAYGLRADPERRLRVGILSSDLHDHPVGRTFASFFRHRDPAAIELACYDTGLGRGTGWFRDRADLWRGVGGLSDRAIAEAIRGDAVDVLILAAGRFDRNRPLVAAFRAAPVQVTIYDGGPSGLGPGFAAAAAGGVAGGSVAGGSAIAAWITDAVMHPVRAGIGAGAGVEAAAGDALCGGDRLVRLPVLHSFLSPDRPLVTRAAAPEEAIVFGSFSNPAKLSEAVLAAWGRILAGVPSASLVLKYRGWYGDREVQARVRDAIGRAGGSGAQLRFLAGADDARAHLARYGMIDLALDPFPFSGATTSFEALAMGVPVLTLAGKAAIGRTTAAILAPLGLEDFIADGVEAYVALACALAGDRARLRHLRGAGRAEIRARLEASPLVDGPAHAASLTRALRGLWREWCARREERQKAAPPR